jgi:uncharacterized iron-regulated membrane protein
MLCFHEKQCEYSDGIECIRAPHRRSEFRMTPWQRWVQRPQSLWVRKIVFQIHLWVGIGAGLYVAVISISGSAIVYQPEFHRTLVVADADRPRMRVEEVEQSARRAYPAYEVVSVVEPEKPDRPDVVLLEGRNQRVVRLFNPYTGADLGDPRSGLERVRRWLADLHDNLLLGLTGRILNGIGSLLVVLIACTGTIVWWPGIKNWRRSIAIRRRARFARFNWDLHSAVGFWCYLLVLIWGISGICLCFPGVLNSLLGPEARAWITRFHFGRFNAGTEALWTVLGLAPAVLAATGALMWWNRVLTKKVHHWKNKRTGAA